MLWKDINPIDMIIKYPHQGYVILAALILVVIAIWISPKGGTGPG